jgi:dihydroorotate dehydrogenase electron transfer subunit
MIMTSACIIDQKYLTPLESLTISKITLFTENKINSLPGQFIRLSLSKSTDPFIPRPFVIFENDDNVIEIIVKKVGRFTDILTSSQSGTKFNLSGPHGAKFVLPEKKTLFVGGGVGVAVLNRFRDSNIEQHFLLGAKNSREAWFADCFPRFQVTTEDGSLGEKGTVLDILPNIITTWKPEQIMVAGPMALLRGTIRIAGDIPCYISMDETMACGVGLCSSCMIKLKNGIAKVCKDGPIFLASEVIF